MRKFLILSMAALTLSAGLWAEDIPNNQIWYTTTDGSTVKFHGSYLFNVAVLSNTNTDGRGVITFEGDLEWIGQATFYQATTLESITFPASLRTIGNSAFDRCTALTEINLNEGLDTIGHAAFSACTALTQISIPASVSALSTLCFYQCKNLTQVYVNWTEANQIPVEYDGTMPTDVPSVAHNAFWEIAYQTELDYGRKYATLYVPVGTENLYYKSAAWNPFGTIKEDLVDTRSAAIALLEAAKQGVTNVHILAIANDAIEAINSAISGLQIEAIQAQALADITKAKAILDDLPTDPEGTAGTAVVITKGNKSVTLYAPDKVTYIKK